MEKRGQAALEFLMTYGWAILVVLVAIGALAYFGVLNPGRFLPNVCTLTPGLGCQDSVITSTQVQMVVQNGMGEDLTITFDTPSCTGSSATIKDGAKATVTLSSCSFSGGRVNEDITMNWTSTEGLAHSATGKITGKY